MWSSCPATATTRRSATSGPICRSGSIEAGERALPADERPFDFRPVHTADLPELPTRDRNIAASAWVEAPTELRTLGADLGHPEAAYKRRISGWLLWRAGPAKGDSRYIAVDPHDVTRSFTFRLRTNGPDDGVGPSGVRHRRFRTWKEDLRDHPAG